MTHLFPLYLDISDKTCLVIGGGKVASRKIQNLFDYGCKIRVVSPKVERDILDWAEQGLVLLSHRKFVEKDLDGVFMVFIATDDDEINHSICNLCRARSLLVNTVDDPPNCDFFVSSVLRRGSLVLAISTEGNSPAFARKLRQELEDIITDEYGQFVELMGEQRVFIKQHIPDINKRKQLFEKLVYSDILDLLKAGEKERAREKVKECMSCYLD